MSGFSVWLVCSLTTVFGLNLVFPYLSLELIVTVFLLLGESSFCHGLFDIRDGQMSVFLIFSLNWRMASLIFV